MKRTPLTMLALAATIVIGGAVFELTAQTPPAAPAATPAAKVEKKAGGDKTFWQVIQQGGFMMIPLGLTSVTMIALVIDGFMRLRNDKLAPPALVEQVRSQFRTGDYNGAYQSCRTNLTVFTNVVRVGLGMLSHGREACERAMEDALAKEVSTLGTRIRYLSVIGVVSPMLGLTGTVLGMIRAFSTIGSSGIGDPSALSAAIGEVLVATATGLFVAIPAFAFYYVFSNRITSVTVFAEDVISSLFRGMPYHEFAGLEVGDEPVYAASPRNGSARSRPSVLSVPEPAVADAELEETEEESPPPAPQPKVVVKPKPKRAVVPQVQCPSCQQPVAIGTEQCPNCQTELNWG